MGGFLLDNETIGCMVLGQKGDLIMPTMSADKVLNEALFPNFARLHHAYHTGTVRYGKAERGAYDLTCEALRYASPIDLREVNLLSYLTLGEDPYHPTCQNLQNLWFVTNRDNQLDRPAVPLIAFSEPDGRRYAVMLLRTNPTQLLAVHLEAELDGRWLLLPYSVAISGGIEGVICAESWLAKATAQELTDGERAIRVRTAAIDGLLAHWLADPSDPIAMAKTDLGAGERTIETYAMAPLQRDTVSPDLVIVDEHHHTSAALRKLH